MTFTRILAVGAIVAISACGRFERAPGCGSIDIPVVDCRPYPKPPTIRPVADGAPRFGETTVTMTHNEFLAVGQANQDIIASLRGAKAVAWHFTQCIRIHNEHVQELQTEVDRLCGIEKKPP